jgi:hypothetical protein
LRAARGSTWIQRRRVASDTAARVAGPAASDDTQLNATVSAATGTGQRRRKYTSATAGRPAAMSSRNRSSVCSSATENHTRTLMPSISSVRQAWLHHVSRGW